MGRRSRRSTFRKALRISVYFGVDEARLRGFIINVSTTGVAIQTNRVFSPGTELFIRVVLDGKPLRARGKIRWARQSPSTLVSRIPSMMGIQLTNVDHGFQEYLENLALDHRLH